MLPARKSNISLLIAFAAAVIFLSFYGLGSFTFFDVDEAVFAQATKEMAESSDWITPTYNGEKRYDKPILFYWIMASSYKIFGVNEFAARFPSAFCGIVLCVALFLFVRLFCNERTALYSSISMALSPFYFVYSHAAVTDMTLTLFIALSLMSFFMSLKINRKYLYGLYVFSALAFLTKGLIGILFPFGIAFIYLIFIERSRDKRSIISPAGILLFIMIALPWYLIEYSLNGNEFLEQFFIKHHFKRYADVVSGHKGAFYYYIPVLAAGVFPWITFLPGGFAGLIKHIRTVILKQEPGVNTHEADVRVFAAIWLGSILIFFSISTTKLPNYILPALPAAFMLAGYGLNLDNSRWKKHMNLTAGMVSFLAAAACFSLRGELEKLSEVNSQWIIIGGLLLFCFGLSSCYSVLKEKTAFISKALYIFLLFVLVSFSALPVLNRHLQGMLYRFSIYAKENFRNNEKIVFYNTSNPSVVFYSGLRPLQATRLNDLSMLHEQYGCIYIIAKDRSIRNLLNSGYTITERDSNYAIFKKGCL